MKSILKLSNGKEVNFTRVNNDLYGNPRYVCHYTNIPNIPEIVYGKDVQTFKTIDSINDRYNEAVKIAKKFGGKKFHNKQYGGGIVFQSYNLNELKPLFE